MPHFPHSSLSPITLNLSISNLPHPHSYLPFQPPASPSTMSQFLSLIIQICSCFPAHTMLCQASVILIILFTCHGTYFSLSIPSLHPTRSGAKLSRKTSVNIQVELDAPYIALSSSNIPLISHCVINISSLPPDSSSLSLCPTVSYSPRHSQSLAQHLENEK